MREICVPADLGNLDEVLTFIEEELASLRLPPKIQTELILASEEIFVNIASYAYGSEVGSAVIGVALATLKNNTPAVEICFSDGGVPYNPLQKPDPDTTLPLEERQIGGLGIYMVKQIADNIDYCYKDGKNVLTISKAI